MKKFLSLLLSVWALASFTAQAQTTTSITSKTATIAPKPGKTGTSYTVWSIRNWNTYPPTTSGLNSWTAAIASGAFNLTVVNSGCVIAAGTIPPLVAPTCSQTVAAPSWVGGFRYSYASPLLTFEGAGGIGKLKFERIDGQSFTTNNPGGVTITSGNYYNPGTLSGQGVYDKEWTLNYTGPALRITAQQASATATYSYTLTPTTAANRIVLTGSNTSPPSSTTTTPPSSTTTSGGGGIPATTAYFADGFGEGTYAQLVNSAPFVPQTNQLSSWNSSNGSGGISSQYLDNGTVKIGFLKALGGAITHLSLNGGKNWVNTNADGYQGNYDGIAAPDPGRSGGPSMYGTPGHDYQEAGQSTSVYYDTGYNPVVGGSAYRNYSPLQWYERRTVPGFGEVVYFESKPYMWALNGVLSKTIHHMWYWFDSQNAIRYFYIVENGRDDNQRIYEGRENEFPFIFTTADLWHHHIYDGNSPGTNGSITDIGPDEPQECGCPENDKVTDALIATEGWISSTNDAGNGVILVPQHNTRVVARQVLSRSGDEFSNATSYINSAVMMNYDVNVATAVSGYIYVGNLLSSFRPWYNAKNITHVGFDWTFRTGTTGGWWSGNQPAKFNSDNKYEFSIGGKSSGGDPNGAFNSPHGRWKASEIPVTYVKGRWIGNGQTRTLNLQWKKPGDTESSAAQNNNTTFQATFDGVERTIQIPMSGVANWNGMIGTIRIQNVYPFPTNYSGTEKFIPTYIGSTNPD
ncbi:hypothetical protein [Spirosoma areae]